MQQYGTGNRTKREDRGKVLRTDYDTGDQHGPEFASGQEDFCDGRRTYGRLALSQPQARGKIARLIATKISIAIKADFFTGRDISSFLEKSINSQLKRIRNL